MDKSLSFGAPDYSAQVAQMKDKKVDLVITCIDGNGAVTLAREMKKQGLNATQILPNAYNQELHQEERRGRSTGATCSRRSRRSRRSPSRRA